MSNRQGRMSQTVQLHRFVKLNDRLDSQIFTFIVPSQLVRGLITEVHSKDFFYCNQAWAIRFQRNETHIGAHIALKNCLAGMKVQLDYSFTVINRDHFTRNESCVQKTVEFNKNSLSHGRPTFCEVSDLKNREFLFDDMKFLIELELKNGLTTFEEDLFIPKDSRELVNCDGRLETAYFAYGTCDWNLIIQIAPSAQADQQQSTSQQSHIPSISLTRHNRFEHWCRVRYRVVLFSGDQTYDTGQIEQQLDTKGQARPYKLDTPFFRNLSSKNSQFRVSIEMQAMSILTTLDLVPTSHNKNCTRFYDSQQQEWLVQSDILGRLVKLRFFYTDVRNVPRNYSRLVCWNAQIIPFSRAKPPVKAISGPYTAFFTQRENEEGYEVAMDLAVEEVCDTSSGYTNIETGSLSIVVEWLHSHLLSQDRYHAFDNLMRLQKLQMSREISVLQAENYALEKQVHLYQQTISTKDINEAQFKRDLIHGSTSSLPNHSMNPAATAGMLSTKTHVSLDSTSSTAVLRQQPTRDVLPRLTLSGHYSGPQTSNNQGGVSPVPAPGPGGTPIPKARTEDMKYDEGHGDPYHSNRSSRSSREYSGRHSTTSGSQYRGRQSPTQQQAQYQTNGGQQHHQDSSRSSAVYSSRHSYGSTQQPSVTGRSSDRSTHSRSSTQQQQHIPRVSTPVLGTEPGDFRGDNYRYPRAASPTRTSSRHGNTRAASYSSRNDYGQGHSTSSSEHRSSNF